MNIMSFVALAIVAFVAGFVFNWGVPRLTPLLPAAVSANMILRTLATGVFILLTVAVAHFVGHLISSRHHGSVT